MSRPLNIFWTTKIHDSSINSQFQYQKHFEKKEQQRKEFKTAYESMFIKSKGIYGNNIIFVELEVDLRQVCDSLLLEPAGR